MQPVILKSGSGEFSSMDATMVVVDAVVRSPETLIVLLGVVIVIIASEK